MGAIHSSGFTDQLYKHVGLLRYLKDRSLHYSEDKTEREYTIYSKRTDVQIASFRARALPGCCGVLVVYYLRPYGITKASKVFSETLSLIIKCAGLAKFGSVLLTQSADSTGDKVILGFPFRTVVEFKNHKTGNKIHCFQIETVGPKESKKVVDTFDGE